MKRIHTIDMLRGLVMVIMALDHLRDFVHESALIVNPTDLTQTDAALFLTRWVTHLCAPTFVFLSGISAYLTFNSANTLKASRNYLLTRGIWLIFLDFTVINFGLWMDINFPVFLFNVLAAIGFGFIILALILKLNPKTIGLLGVTILLFHSLFAILPVSSFKQIFTPLFSSTAIPFANQKLFIMGYPPIPWLGIMLTGFGAGSYFLNRERKSIFLKAGLSCLSIFLVFRFFNLYGDPVAWSAQKDAVFTFLSFLNVSKYPPSLFFCLLMLGIMFLIAYLLEGKRNSFLEVFGSVPLFYFVIHWFVLHLLQFGLILSDGFSFTDFKFGTNFGRPEKWQGVSLVTTYLTWIVAVIILYPICKWYSGFKKGKNWLRYL